MKMGLRQLSEISGIAEESISHEMRVEVETHMRLMWADNGDQISVMYAGTPAIRGDHTRTGKTTMKGMLNDGLNALSRFYINNFEDGENQDALDILLEKRPLPSSYHLDLKVRPFKKLDKVRSLLTNFFVFFFTLLRPPHRHGVNLLWAFAWMSLVWLVFTLFRLDAQRIVGVPVLKWNHVKATAKGTTLQLDGEDTKDDKGKGKEKAKSEEIDLSNLKEEDLDNDD
jgi:hypothetical protein